MYVTYFVQQHQPTDLLQPPPNLVISGTDSITGRGFYSQPSMHPLPELLPRIAATWTQKGIRPKQHLSSPRPGAESVMEKRAHADRCHELPVDLPEDMDLMIEVSSFFNPPPHLLPLSIRMPGIAICSPILGSTDSDADCFFAGEGQGAGGVPSLQDI